MTTYNNVLIEFKHEHDNKRVMNLYLKPYFAENSGEIYVHGIKIDPDSEYVPIDTNYLRSFQNEQIITVNIDSRNKLVIKPIDKVGNSIEFQLCFIMHVDKDLDIYVRRPRNISLIVTDSVVKLVRYANYKN